MLALSLLWLVLGIFIGLLAIAARLYPASWSMKKWPVLLITGLLAALCGGWLGTLLLGRFFATAVALWVAVLCVVLVPLLARSIQRS